MYESTVIPWQLKYCWDYSAPVPTDLERHSCRENITVQHMDLNARHVTRETTGPGVRSARRMARKNQASPAKVHIMYRRRAIQVMDPACM